MEERYVWAKLWDSTLDLGGGGGGGGGERGGSEWSQDAISSLISHHGKGGLMPQM